MSQHIFISHASADDAFVAELRPQLEENRIPVWVDSRNLRGGNKLAPEIEKAINEARQVIVVLSPQTINSPWVRQEIKRAVEVEDLRKDDGYRVIPLLLPGVQPSALPLWFEEEPVGVRVEISPGGLGSAMPEILAALGERLPTDHQPAVKVTSQPLEELVLKLVDPLIETVENKRRAKATATIVYEPADPTSRSIESPRFTFVAPLGPIERDELRWYLEKYYLWPVGVFQQRASRVEAQLPEWGHQLYRAALTSESARKILDVWQNTADDAARCFSIVIDNALLEGTNQEEQTNANEAAGELLSLPWELLHDGRGYLFQGARPTRVRRRMPNRHSQRAALSGLPIRILLVSPRPEDNRTAYIDHRLSARPLMDAIDSLGDLARLTVLAPPTFPKMQEALKQAADRGERFDVVHFDGHGVFNRVRGLGALCFEDPADVDKLERRASKLIEADQLAAVIRDSRIPLVFLDACQTAMHEKDPTASVAVRLLDEGVASVVAMSHSVLVETAHRFVRAFYAELALGRSTGAAMIAGQRTLSTDLWRGRIPGAGDLYLHDWFVPVLYQEERDAPLVTELRSEEVQQLEARQRKLRLGDLPDEPKHRFQGRSRELLKLERLLSNDEYAVVRGQGGAGKTTLAVELARWLVRARRFRRAAFVSLEEYSDARGVLDSLGHQLLPEGYSVAGFVDLKEALQPVERALCDSPTIIVLDNFESLLSPVESSPSPDRHEQATAESREEILKLCRRLLDAHPATRIVFTSRELLPAPFDLRRRDVQIGALDREDAIALVTQVMKEEGLEPKADDAGGTPKEIEELVDAVNCHARALELLAHEVSRRGVRATTENLHQIMAELERRHPGDRKNSLYASIELSLQRLPAAIREQAKALAVFHGGAHLSVLDAALNTPQDDTDTVRFLAQALIAVGLAEQMAYGHLKIDPALPSYMRQHLTPTELEEFGYVWARAMNGLALYLYEQHFQDVKMASTLTLLELPNLMATLAWLQERESAEVVIELANKLELLTSRLGQESALKQAIKVRELVSQSLTGWSHSKYLAESAAVDRLLEQGDLSAAYTLVQQLLKECLQAKPEAYPSAAFDTAAAYLRLGRVSQLMGATERALEAIIEARQRSESLVEKGDKQAVGLLTTAMLEQADCLRDLGRLDEAASLYTEAIKRDEEAGDERGVAIAKAQLGTVRMFQKRYEEALEAFQEVLAIANILNEPDMQARALHQIGMVYRHTGRFELAEQSYRQKLAITVKTKDFEAEASALGELGSLYVSWERLEDSVSFYRQAANAYFRLQNPRREGLTRNNLAIPLIMLGRYDEARVELMRAIECNAKLGSVAEPWKTWSSLCELEKITKNNSAAAKARENAIEGYMSYRRSGGVSQSRVFQLLEAVYSGITQRQTKETNGILDELSRGELDESSRLLCEKLKKVVKGSRDVNLAADPKLDYDHAVELRLLLEALP
jgi:tetratricopeptide (TPR) repeat protein